MAAISSAGRKWWESQRVEGLERMEWSLARSGGMTQLPCCFLVDFTSHIIYYPSHTSPRHLFLLPIIVLVWNAHRAGRRRRSLARSTPAWRVRKGSRRGRRLDLHRPRAQIRPQRDCHARARYGQPRLSYSGALVSSGCFCLSSLAASNQQDRQARRTSRRGQHRRVRASIQRPSADHLPLPPERRRTTSRPRCSFSSSTDV